MPTKLRTVFVRILASTVALLTVQIRASAQEAPAATQPKPQAAPSGGEPAIAEKFAQFAQATLANPSHPITEVNFKEASALLEAAARLNPQEPRYFRLLAEADLQAHNPDAALEALRS